MKSKTPSNSLGSSRNFSQKEGNTKRFTLYGVITLLVLAVIGWFYFHLIDTQTLGFTHDDGVYAVAGKSLAAGKGFKLLHVVGQPGEIKYPFVYPAILALVWLVNPHFPQNLMALNDITLFFSLAGLGMSYCYLRHCQKFPGWLALLILALCTSSFFFMYFFSSIMSEGPYLFFSMLTLWCAYRFSQKQPVLSLQSILILIVLSSLTFLTRVTGVTLMAAIGIWLLLNRQWRNAFIYGIGVFITGLLPWMLWVKFNTPVINDFTYPLVNTYSNYGLEFIHNYKGGNYLNGVRQDIFSLVNHWLEDMIPAIPHFIQLFPKLKAYPDLVKTIPTIALYFAYGLFGYYIVQVVNTLMNSVVNKRLNSAVFTIPGLYLFFYIMVITLWNYEDQMARFLTVMLPLLWMFFFKPLLPYLPEFGQKWPQAKQGAVVASLALILLMVVCVIVPGADAYKVVSASRSRHWVDSGKFPFLWEDYQGSFGWINTNLPADAKLSAASDVVYYLYTNRLTYYTFYASLRRENGLFLDSSIPLLMKSMDHYGINYLVAEPHMQSRTVRFPVNLVSKSLMNCFPKRFQLVYTSSHNAIHIYKIAPPSSLTSYTCDIPPSVMSVQQPKKKSAS